MGPRRTAEPRSPIAPIDRRVHIGARVAVSTLLIAWALICARSPDRHSPMLAATAALFAAAALALVGIVRRLEWRLARLREEADLDPLTKVLNRGAFSRLADVRMTHTRGARAGGWALVMVDLDNFGALNKRRGHLEGDRMLRLAADRIELAVQPHGSVGRLGGDEFAALVPAANAQETARAVLARLSEGPEPVAASIGLAASCAADRGWEAALSEADMALRVAKRDGKNRVMVFAEGIDGEEHVGRRRVLEAIEGDPIEIAVQPIVDLASGRVYAYEALSRFPAAWLTGPAELLATAESLGLRVELELACLRSSLKLLESLPAGASLSVNLSALALRDRRARQLLLGDRPERLILEITEEGLVGDVRGLRAALEPLRSAGIRLAIDDMGAGYSNLRQVVELTPSLLKLDRTLVHGIDGDPAKTVLIDALTGYAQRTGAQIVAEGIETKAELDVLHGLGIAYGQGYLLARPQDPWPVVASRPRQATRVEDGVRGSQPVTIEPHETADRARRRFAALAELESLVIVDRERRPVGLLTRNRLLARLGQRFGYALWGDKPALTVADRNFLCLPAGADLGELARKSLARPLEHRHDPVLLVDEQGRLAGQVTMGDLLFSNYVNAPRAVESQQSVAAVRA